MQVAVRLCRSQSPPSNGREEHAHGPRPSLMHHAPRLLVAPPSQPKKKGERVTSYILSHVWHSTLQPAAGGSRHVLYVTIYHPGRGRIALLSG